MVALHWKPSFSGHSVQFDRFFHALPLVLDVSVFLEHNFGNICSSQGFYVVYFVKEHWVAQGMENIIWLPLEYHASCGALVEA